MYHAGEELQLPCISVIPLMPATPQQAPEATSDMDLPNTCAKDSDTPYSNVDSEMSEMDLSDTFAEHSDTVDSSDGYVESETCSNAERCSSCDGSAAQQVQQVHGPVTLQQAVADSIQTAAFNAGSSDNLAVMVLDISPQASVFSLTEQQMQPQSAATKFLPRTQSVDSPSELSSKPADLHAVPAELQTSRNQFLADEPVSLHAAPAELQTSSSQTLAAEPVSLHAVPAELQTSRRQLLADDPSMMLWQDNSLIISGSASDQKRRSKQYKLLSQMASLPRYADHIHASWTGLPVLGSMSLWLQPSWPSFATSQGFSSSTEGDFDPDQALLYDDAAASALAVSPGSMLQLSNSQMLLPSSCVWGAQDCHAAVAASATHSDIIADSHGEETDHDEMNRHEFNAMQTADVFAAMPLVNSPDHNQQHQLPASRHASSPDEHKLALLSQQRSGHDKGWAKYKRGRDFARGSFGEVWRADQTDTGTVTSLCNDCLGYPGNCSYINLSLLRDATVVRMQCLVSNGLVLTLRLSLC